MSAFRSLLRFRGAEREREREAAFAAPRSPLGVLLYAREFAVAPPPLPFGRGNPDATAEWRWDATLPDDEPRTGPVGPLLEELFENKSLRIGPYTLRLVHGFHLIHAGVTGDGPICVPPAVEPRSWSDRDAVRRVAIVHARSLIAAILAGREVRWLATGWVISSAQTQDEVERRPDVERQHRLDAEHRMAQQPETIRWETT